MTGGDGSESRPTWSGGNRARGGCVGKGGIHLSLRRPAALWARVACSGLETHDSGRLSIGAGSIAFVAEDSKAQAGSDGGGALSTRLGSVKIADPDEHVLALIESDATAEELARGVGEQEAPDAADTLESLEPGESAEVLHEMDVQAAAAALSYMELPLAATVLQDLPVQEAAELVSFMEPDDAADVLQELPEGRAEELLRELPRRKAADLAKLALYDPETAGGLMNTRFLKLSRDSTVAEAIEWVRSRSELLDQPDIYVVDEQKRLSGVVPIRALVVNGPEALVGEIMDSEVEALDPGMDREAVAMMFDRYDHLTLPVVDAHRRLLGVVTIDDVVDIIRAEHTEDVFKQVGAGAGESVYAPLGTKLRGRFPWLMINLGMASIAALVVLRFESLIEQIALLAVVMPIIANQAGNAGHQALAVTLRGLVLGEVRRGRALPLLVRESLLGLVSGFLIGSVIWLALALLGGLGLHDEANWRIGLIAAMSMAGALAIGCLTGSGVPLLLERLGFDPAAGSSIFVTMITDTVSFATFLGLAFALQTWIVPVL